MSDLINRRAAIDIDGLDEEIRCEMCKNPMRTDRGCDGHCEYDEKLYKKIMQILDERIKRLPSAQPEQSIAEWQKDFREYINMLNIPRDDYNGIMEYINEVPSAQPDMSEYSVWLWRNAYECGKSDAQEEIIRCKDCKFYTAYDYTGKLMCKRIGKGMILPKPEDYCSYAERISDG